MHSNHKVRSRRYGYQFINLAIYTFSILLLFILLFNHKVDATIEYPGDYNSHGTKHEQAGIAHYPPVEYSKYVPWNNYTVEPPYISMGMDPVYNLTHIILDYAWNKSEGTLPAGYMTVRDGYIFGLGPLTIRNDWYKLLKTHRWWLHLWLLPMMLLIVLMPFFGVCYLCFGFYRCRYICQPCDTSHDTCKRWIFSILLLFITFGIIAGTLITSLSHRQIRKGFHYTDEKLRRGGKDTCNYLQDVSLHTKHLLITNYKELRNHAINQIENAYRHILMDLADTSESNALTELERIMDNMPEALRLMKELDQKEKELRFYGSMLRDALRGVKREIAYTNSYYCDKPKCLKFVSSSGIMEMDTSKCLHYDLVPNTTVFVETMERIIKRNLAELPKRGIARLEIIGGQLRKLIGPIIPPLKLRYDLGYDMFKSEATYINDLISAAISDVYLRTLHSAQSFRDIYEHYEYNNAYATGAACFIQSVMSFLLIAGLLCGLFLRSSPLGSGFMTFVMLVIFFTFSFLTIVGIFYFMIGLITYHDACAENWKIGFPEHVPKLRMAHNDQLPSTEPLVACKKDETIFGMLKENNLYDPEVIRHAKFIDDENDPNLKWHEFKGDLTKVILLKNYEKELLYRIQRDLFPYHGILYTEYMCLNLSNIDLKPFAKKYYKYGVKVIFKEYNARTPGKKLWIATSSLVFTHRDLKRFIEFEPIVKKLVRAIKYQTALINRLILGEDLNFGETLRELIEAITRSENFIRKYGRRYINDIGQNLSLSIEEYAYKYKHHVYQELQTNVGACKPLAYIFRSDAKYVCRQIIDPINTLWLGILLSSMLYLPLLFVAHRLTCYYQVPPPIILPPGCPTCTGAPIVHKPRVVCTGGQQQYCICVEGNMKKRL